MEFRFNSTPSHHLKPQRNQAFREFPSYSSQDDEAVLRLTLDPMPGAWENLSLALPVSARPGTFCERWQAF